MDIRALFLSQSLKDCEEAFADQIKRPSAITWDWVIITAASEAQAAAYRAQIDMRLRERRLPRATRYAVIADPGGRRVGSGGATLNVLREIARAEGGEAPFDDRRILVLHSGGDSQRIPQYSATGKLFGHVPRTLAGGRASTLFDEFMISLSNVPARMQGGMLLLSGDVLLLFNALQIDLERAGAACLSIKAPVETGTRHGVFVADAAGGVGEFLHKQPESVLRARGAVNEQGMVDIDTGAIWFDAGRVKALYGLIAAEGGAFDRFVNDTVRLSLYGDIVYPLSTGATLESYLAQAAEGEPGEALAACRRQIFEALGQSGLSMIRLAPAEFIHFGTTDEWRRLMLHGAERFHSLGWRRDAMSAGVGEGYAAVGALIEPGARIAPGCAIEDARIGKAAVLGQGCVVSGADVEGEVPANAVLSVLPIEGGAAYCARLYGVGDNPKEAVRFGAPIAEALWTAPLHPVAPTMREAVKAAVTGEWTGRRISLRDSFALSSMPDILARQSRLTHQILARQVLSSVAADTPLEALSPLLEGEDATPLLAALEAQAQAAPFPLRHRLFQLLSRATGDPAEALRYEDACWQAINDHMMDRAREGRKDRPAPRIAVDRAEITLPVRVNFGGGWSDTPPYCLEHGGTVLNASLLLDGRRPVRAVCERLSEPVIRIGSGDLGIARTYTRLEQLTPGDPHDPHALCKAGLAALGLLPEGAEGPLAPVLEAMGGGLSLYTEVQNVPKGSGLGTSSIVSAAVARALSEVFGLRADDAHIAEVTLLMEQLMQTGGGWQDQVGGLVRGIKLTYAQPGTPQRLKWRAIEMPEAAFRALSDRFALVFTGQRRMARSLLREIMGKVIGGDREALDILQEIQRLAVLMAFALEKGDIDEFARLLTAHWALSKRLDAGSSNTCIDHMIATAEDLICGTLICGAGGGGFMAMILREGVTHAMLKERLAGVFQESGVAVWDAALER